MKLSRKALTVSWAWLSALAVVMGIVLYLLDGVLKAKTGFGTASMQFVGSGYDLRLMMDHWIRPPDMALVGFLFGLDFLFMPLYGAALFCGALVALDRFAPAKGNLRRLMIRLSLAPIAAALCDAIENSLSVYMLTHTPTNALASFAMEATAGKWLGIAIGLALTVAALIGKFVVKPTE
ncbi:hypothetical protein FHS83_001942 [Rhizomicrobium palustre]|uniref:Uncharacterized protein n=1 Tax=Rhizomicrobium palustre TaxID=189966 RepID=A0A846MYB7_9PROT|nr:hypothetical protein [Rhizomicrobium palustre]NIK88624.1 hypothetical protein [Rhizomicrobium palustre]